MKIGIFLEKFTNTEIEKDPGIIASGLLKKGVNLKVFSCLPSKKISQKFNTTKINKNEYENVSYWKESNIETLIIYSWLSIRYTKMIKSAKKAGLKVILKLDSDGFLIHPLKPNYLKIFGINKNINSKIIHIIRILEWYLVPRLISKIKIKQIKLSNAVIIETPKAKENLLYSLSYWNKKELFNKIHFIPNPIIATLLNINNKKNIITCIGRWDDLRKNPNGLLKVLSNIKTNWEINIIGTGSINLTNKIKNNNTFIKITPIEQLKHKQVFECLAYTKILLIPSVAEGSPLVVSEALCCGCSVVGGPLPSFEYFINNKTSGTISNNFKYQSLKQALEIDIKKWENNEYNPKKIAKYWQEELSERKISKQIIGLIKSL